MRDLLLASQNPGKLSEMRQLVEGLPFHVLGPREVGLREAPEETGHTFLENAVLKARHYAGLSGLLTVADDSGLSVEALDGGPGLYSSRFGGEGASDDDRNRLLLDKLRGVPRARRRARFTSAVAVARHVGEPGAIVGPTDTAVLRYIARDRDVLFEVEESVDGLIAEEPRGTNGFGYDPVFFYPPFGKTLAEVPRGDKDRVSHRGKAFARLREFLTGLR